MFIKVKEEKS